jgi:hypothetical protein
VPADSQLIIEILHFNLECPYDYVQFGYNYAAHALKLCAPTFSGKTYNVSPQTSSVSIIKLYTLLLIHKR